jgi:site-specific DNA recombinase
MADKAVIRCGIYTRTSSDEGLIQEYNSLASQRDACIAYIASQKSEGWMSSRTVYEDGGVSGGTLDRPALRDLLQDIAAGQIDIIVLYKIDRLTRSLRDFAKLSEMLDRFGVSFVAVTQQFSTASSMGRLTLNILLTFAQFEREVAGDRIRDKKASSTRVGIWMGGNPALGYDAPAKKLVVNPKEAEVVRYIYRRFLELRSMAELRKDLERHGIVSKKKVTKQGVDYGGRSFTWHPLRTILTNPLYRGMIRHKTALYPGRHEAIVSHELFDEVQRTFAQVAAQEKEKRALAYPALLRSIVFDSAGEPLYPKHTMTVKKRHNYYVTRSLMARSHLRRPGNWLRVSAPKLERCVLDLLTERMRDRNWILCQVPTSRRLRFTLDKAQELAREVSGQLERNTGVIAKLVRRVEIDKVTLRLLLNRSWLYERLGLVACKGSSPFGGGPIEVSLTGHGIRCGNEMRAVLESAGSPPQRDHRLVKGVLRAIRWFNSLATGEFATMKELAEVEGCGADLISDRIGMAFLAPDIVEAILEGRQPPSLTLAKLARACPLPTSWEEQRKLLM